MFTIVYVNLVDLSLILTLWQSLNTVLLLCLRYCCTLYVLDHAFQCWECWSLEGSEESEAANLLKCQFPAQTFCLKRHLILC